MVIKRSRKAKKGDARSEDIKDHNGAPLKYLNMLSTMQSMSDYVVQTSKEGKPKTRLRKAEDRFTRVRGSVSASGHTNWVRVLAFVGRLRGRMMVRRRRRASAQTDIVANDALSDA